MENRREVNLSKVVCISVAYHNPYSSVKVNTTAHHTLVFVTARPEVIPSPGSFAWLQLNGLHVRSTGEKTSECAHVPRAPNRFKPPRSLQEDMVDLEAQCLIGQFLWISFSPLFTSQTQVSFPKILVIDFWECKLAHCRTSTRKANGGIWGHDALYPPNEVRPLS